MGIGKLSELEDDIDIDCSKHRVPKGMAGFPLLRELTGGHISIGGPSLLRLESTCVEIY